MPSIRLMALLTNTMMNTVSGAPTQNGISWKPQKPYRSLMYRPEKGMMSAAMICAANFTFAPRPIRSSTMPTL